MSEVNPVRKGPLEGIRVIEVANFVSGPLAAMMMSDLGTLVTKVEAPRGDPMRRFGRSGWKFDPIFVNSNRGKRGVIIDLTQAEGQAELHGLLKDADVLLSNWRPSVAPRLGLADELLTEMHPRLIRIYMTGFGTEGPRVDMPVYDAVVQAHLGAAENSPPSILPSYVIDKTAAALVVQAALAALFARERGGPAERIDMSLLDAAAYLNFVDLMANRTFVDSQPAEASYRQGGATRAIRASNGWLVVVPVTADQIRRACAVVGRHELAAEVLSMPDATSLTSRLLAELERETQKDTVDHWLTSFAESDVPAGPCLTIDEHLNDEQVGYNHTYDIYDWPGLGKVRCVRYPARFSSWGELWPTGAPPPGPAARPSESTT